MIREKSANEQQKPHLQLDPSALCNIDMHLQDIQKENKTQIRKSAWTNQSPLQSSNISNNETRFQHVKNLNIEALGLRSTNCKFNNRLIHIDLATDADANKVNCLPVSLKPKQILENPKVYISLLKKKNNSQQLGQQSTRASQQMQPQHQRESQISFYTSSNSQQQQQSYMPYLYEIEKKNENIMNMTGSTGLRGQSRLQQNLDKSSSICNAGYAGNGSPGNGQAGNGYTVNGNAGKGNAGNCNNTLNSFAKCHNGYEKKQKFYHLYKREKNKLFYSFDINKSFQGSSGGGGGGGGGGSGGSHCLKETAGSNYKYIKIQNIPIHDQRSLQLKDLKHQSQIESQQQKNLGNNFYTEAQEEPSCNQLSFTQLDWNFKADSSSVQQGKRRCLMTRGVFRKKDKFKALNYSAIVDYKDGESIISTDQNSPSSSNKQGIFIHSNYDCNKPKKVRDSQQLQSMNVTEGGTTMGMGRKEVSSNLVKLNEQFEYQCDQMELQKQYFQKCILRYSRFQKLPVQSLSASNTQQQQQKELSLIITNQFQQPLQTKKVDYNKDSSNEALQKLFTNQSILMSTSINNIASNVNGNTQKAQSSTAEMAATVSEQFYSNKKKTTPEQLINQKIISIL